MGSLIRYERPASLANWMDELFNGSVFSLADRDISGARWPRVDIVEEKDGYRIKADLPGLEKDNISVTMENGTLTLSGEKKEEKKEHDKDSYYHYERSYGSFSRSFTLPEDVDQEHVEANYKNGVLEVKLRKSEKAKPKAIEVKVQ